MLKKVIFAIAALAFLLAAASYFSPHWTVHQMRGAIEKRDYAAFSQYVDFPALRESFKEQMASALREKMQNGKEDDPLTSLGQGIFLSLAGPMLDIMITPAGVIEMMNAGVPQMTQAVITSVITQVPSAAEPIPDMKVSYRGWDTVAFHKVDAPKTEVGSFILRRQGLWRWRLAAVEVPPV